MPSIFGTVSSWISAGGIMGILSLLVWAQLGNRKLAVEEHAVANVDKADIRDHYAEEVSALRERLDVQATKHSKDIVDVEGKYRKLLQETEEHYKTLLAGSDKAHEECKRDRDALRGEVTKMREEISGLRNQIVTQASDRVLALGKPGAAPPSKDVVGAAKRVKRIRRNMTTRGADKRGKP